MAWYYYSGKTVKPIPIKKGVSRAVRPYSKIEIEEWTLEAEALRRKRELRKVGSPKKGKIETKVVSIDEIRNAIKETITANKLSDRIEEIGKINTEDKPSKTEKKMEDEAFVLKDGKTEEKEKDGHEPISVGDGIEIRRKRKQRD